MNKTKLVAMIVLAFAVIALAVIGYDFFTENHVPENARPSASEEEREATLAPDFTVYDMEGNPVHLSDFVGKPVVIDFWATWCGYCMDSLPHYEKIWQEYGDEIVFLMINADGEGYEEEVAELMAEEGYTFPVYFDSDFSAVNAYSAYSLPAAGFVNADGTWNHGQIGYMEEEQLREHIERLLGQ